MLINQVIRQMINQSIDQPITPSDRWIGPSIALACSCTVRFLAILKLLNETVYYSVYIFNDTYYLIYTNTGNSPR